MQILMGFLLCLFLEGLAYLGWRAWHPRPLRLPLQPPRTAAQLANEQVFAELERNTPRLVSMRLQRRTARGRRRRIMEREEDMFEE